MVRNGKKELVLCFVSLPYILSPSSSFSPRFRLCSFFYLFLHLASLISSYVQYDDGVHKAERSTNTSELCAVRQATQCMTTKPFLFPKLRTVWFFCVVVLRLVPVLAGKYPVKVGCSGVGGLARFQIFPRYTWIRPMRVQTESCWIRHDESGPSALRASGVIHTSHRQFCIWFHTSGKFPKSKAFSKLYDKYSSLHLHIFFSV